MTNALMGVECDQGLFGCECPSCHATLIVELQAITPHPKRNDKRIQSSFVHPGDFTCFE